VVVKVYAVEVKVYAVEKRVTELVMGVGTRSERAAKEVAAAV
jgi:hypothetical protein